LIINAIQIINIAGAYVAGFAMIFPEYLMFLVLVYFIIGFGYGIINRNTIVNDQVNKSLAKHEEV
jgi:CDP-diacylglycerol--serine O-phosphatidyltransferase